MTIATAGNGWINTADCHHPEVIAKVRFILETTSYCTLSTSSPDGMPWASPLFFGYDSSWTLYWSSALASRHSQNLGINRGRAAIVIYGTHGGEGQGQGVYLTGTAGEIEPDQIDTVIDLLNQRSGTSGRRCSTDYLPPSPRRLYQLRPQKLWVTGERVLHQGVLMDTKIRLHLDQLPQIS